MICRRYITGIMMAASGALTLPVPASGAAVYRLDLSRGVWPPGVTAENASGTDPDLSAYKRGYTLDGWMIDRLYDRGYVAVSPTYTGSDAVCGNILSLPPLVFAGDEWLKWEAISVHPYFAESYRVEAVPSAGGEPVVLAGIEGEESDWRARTVSLSALAGKEMTIRFVATGSGYMLAIGGVETAQGYPSYLEFTDMTPAFQGEDGTPEVRFGFTGIGADTALDGIRCRFLSGTEVIAEETSGAVTIREGETSMFSFPVPEEAWPEVSYEIEVIDHDGVQSSGGGFGAGHTYVGAFRQSLLVDRGTGMWCVNCPEGDVAAESLKSEFGDGLIMLNTHVNDCLANQAYWENLGWYSVPRMMLGRDRSTEGSDAGKFAGRYYRQPSFGISLDQIKIEGGTMLSVTSHVRVAETVDNSDGRYRIGYVATGDFHEPLNPEFVQKNNCSRPAYGAYYYLPSAIPPALMYYEDVTLTSGSAFDGVEASLPGSMTPGEEYSHSFDIALPRQLQPESAMPVGIDAAHTRVVAFVIDTSTGLVENAVALRVGEDPAAGIAVPGGRADAGISMRMDAAGRLTLRMPEGEAYTLEIFSADGVAVGSVSGRSTGCDIVPLDLAGGIHLLRLVTPSGVKTLKVLSR